MFLPAAKHYSSKLPVVLFFDGHHVSHHSHMSLKLIEVAHSNNVHFLICFPPHCAHILQPLDVAIFGPLKATWQKVLKEHQLKTCAANVTKEDFPSLLANLWKDSFLLQHFINGFPKVGFAHYQEEQFLLASCLKPYLILMILSKSHKRKFPKITPANLRTVKSQRLLWK